MSRKISGLGSLCRCMCSGYWEQNGTRDSSMNFEEELPFTPSPIVGKLSYSISSSQPLRGVPIREGHLWYVAAEDKIDMVFFSLYINGFAFLKSNDRQEIAVSLNPFALVRNCKFQSEVGLLREFKIFKVSLFPQAVCYYFGVKNEEERSHWVLDISHAMRLVTQSLYPPFKIRTSPLDHVPLTHRRLMAGYLLHLDGNSAVLVYCELHAHFNDQARLIMYENETCQVALEEITISESSICCEKVGINCSCFCIEDHNLSSRTLSERKLWLRAFSNVKVKVQNRAPTPTPEQLTHYRSAINEHLSTLMERVEVPLSMDPLLQKNSVLACGSTQPECVSSSSILNSSHESLFAL